MIRPSTFSCGRDPPGLSRRRSRAAAAVGQPSPPVVLVAPFLKAYRAPFGSTSVEASSPSRSHISRKCECAAAHSLRSADHHLAMKSTTRTIRGNVTDGSEASTTVPANPACCYHSIRKNHEFISHTPQTQDPPPATLPIRCRVVLGRKPKSGESTASAAHSAAPLRRGLSGHVKTRKVAGRIGTCTHLREDRRR